MKCLKGENQMPYVFHSS